VDRVLGPPARSELAERLEPVPAEARRQAFRHLASEINRWSFRWWSRAQLVLGMALVALCWTRPGASRHLAAACVAIVVAQLALVPPIVDLGRSIDFVARPLPPDVARRFGLLHSAFMATDVAKAVLLAAAAWLTGRR
jgi:hypothetical protein